jgi:hypothetical protein
MFGGTQGTGRPVFQHVPSGRTLSDEEVYESPVLLSVQSSQPLHLAFDTDDEYLQWTASSPYARLLRLAYEGEERLRAMTDAELATLGDRTMEASATRRRKALAAAGRADDTQLSADDIVSLLNDDRLSDDPAIFYDGQLYGGASVDDWGVDIPDLRTWGWDKRIASVKIVPVPPLVQPALGTLYDSYGFQGRKFRMTGWPTYQANLADVGFFKIASSFSFGIPLT